MLLIIALAFLILFCVTLRKNTPSANQLSNLKLITLPIGLNVTDLNIYEFSSDRSDPSTFDCSDFTRWAYLSALGMDIPKDSRSQATYVQSFSNRTYTTIDQAQRGDLLFFVSYNGTNPDNYIGMDKSIGNITHVGIYLGNGKIIHTASAATGGVRIDEIANHLTYRFALGGSVLDTK
ncbi:hypothetical protein GC102_02825 [Paenibacillus sp. LMG 31460]|uniref:NlpC/P60 domain-containing protein n=1 Tax=Paenibacillus germinis TaxID=2654979 RepID=A0ABX1YXB8_9BACL|nr:hypothetical protein [Paenibacillus germinis]